MATLYPEQNLKKLIIIFIYFCIYMFKKILPLNTFRAKLYSPTVGRTLIIFFRVVEFGNKFGAYPYEWNKNDNTLVVTKSMVKLPLWYLGGILYGCHTIFMYVRLIQAVYFMNASNGIIFTNLLSISTYTTCTLLHLNTFLHMKEIPIFVNQLIKTTTKFKENELENISSSEKPITTYKEDTLSPAGKIVCALYIYCSSQFFRSLSQASNPKYITSLIPNIQHVSKLKLIPFAIYDCLLSFNGASGVLFYTVLSLAYVRNTKLCIEILDKDGWKSMENIHHYYRILQLVNTRFNSCFKQIAQPVLYVMMLFVVILSNYATFKLFDEVPMPAYLNFPSIFIAMGGAAKASLPEAGEVYEFSKNFITKMKAKTKDGIYERFFKSCKPLQVSVPGFSYIKGNTFVTFFSVAIDNTVNLLLSF